MQGQPVIQQYPPTTRVIYVPLAVPPPLQPAPIPISAQYGYQGPRCQRDEILYWKHFHHEFFDPNKMPSNLLGVMPPEEYSRRIEELNQYLQ
ncbi:hypothetical protein HDU76_000153, partial [Blyttiomyces sp. JEL0837]